MSASVRRSSSLFRILVSLTLLVGSALVFLYRQELLDQYTVWQFKPTPAISAISERSALSDRGEFLFYASRPALLERDSFNDACRSVATEQTAVLGCYSASRIYLFNIDNEKLDGIKEVTAAHEMLHAAYERLSPQERDRINTLLDTQPLGDDESRIRELMAEYEKSEPGERLNELHSILGSELRVLSPELETYYGQYFSDRTTLVELSDKYQSVFVELQNRQAALVSELNALADAIDSDSAVYRRELQVLESDIRAFNERAGSGTMTRQEYEAQRAELERSQRALKQEYETIQLLIKDYESKRSELASINTESNALNRSINSSLTPAPTSESLDG